MRPPLRCFACVCSFAFALACAGLDDSRERCDDVTSQIDQALLDYIDAGYLRPDAVACELTPASVDPGVSPDNVERLLGQFQAACDTQAQVCSGIGVRPPRSVPPYAHPEPVSGPPPDAPQPPVLHE